MTRARWMPALALALVVLLRARAAGRAAPAAATAPDRGQPRREQSASGQPRIDPQRHGALPHALRRLSRPGCHRLSRARPHRASMAAGVTDERLFQTRSARACPAPRCRRTHDDRRRRHPDDHRVSAQARHASRRRSGRSATSRTASGCSRAQCASCHRVAGRGGRLGPDLTRDRRRAIARRARPRDPHAVRMGPAGVRDGHARHQGRPAHPRRQEERRRVLASRSWTRASGSRAI